MDRFPPYPRKPHASGQARLTVNGQAIYLGPHNTKESKEKYAELAKQHATGKPLARAKKADRILDVIDAWFERGETRYRPSSTEPKEIASALTVLHRVAGQRPAKELTPLLLEHVRLAMGSGSWLTEAEKATREKRRQAIGWSRRVANRMTIRICTVWRWAERQQLVPPGAWSSLLTLGPLEAGDPRFRDCPKRTAASWEQVEAVLPLLSPTLQAAMVVQWNSGMRPSELMKLTLSQIDQVGLQGCWLYRPPAHKQSHKEAPRTVVFNSRCQEVLKPLLAVAKLRPAGIVFAAGKFGKAYGPAAYSRAISRACVATKTPAFAPYQIRHAAKQRAVRAVGLDAARALLGQLSLQTTDGYDHHQDILLAILAAKALE